MLCTSLVGLKLLYNILHIRINRVTLYLFKISEVFYVIEFRNFNSIFLTEKLVCFRILILLNSTSFDISKS